MIQFENLSLSVPEGGGNRTSIEDGKKKCFYFKDLTGGIREGSLTLITGASKEFLECLSGVRKDFTGKIISSSSSRSALFSTYIPSDYCLFDSLLVGEMFDLTIALRRPSLLPEKKSFLIECFGFTKHLKKSINLCSPVEQRKISILQELFMEIPFILINDIRNLDLTGRKEILSSLQKVIQQYPTTTILALIDDARDSLLAFVDDVLIVNTNQTGIIYQGSSKSLASNPCWRGFEEIDDHSVFDFDNINTTLLSSPSSSSSSSYKRDQVSAGKRFLLLLNFHFKRRTTRNPTLLMMFAFKAIFFGVFTGLLYLDSSQYAPPIQIKNKFGVLYFFAFSSFFSGAIVSLVFLFGDKKMLSFHTSNRWYGIGTFWIAMILIELTIYFLFPCIEFLIAYYLIGLNSAFSLYLFSATFIGFTSVSGFGLSLLIGSITDSIVIISLITPLILVPLLLLSGLCVGVDSEPSWLSWIRYIDPIYYCYAGLMQNEFDGHELPNCDPSLYEDDLCSSDEVIKSSGLGDLLPVGVNLTLLITITLAFILLSFIIIKVKVR